ELRGLSKILSAFGLGEISHVALGIGRVATSLGALGAALVALGLGLSALYKLGEGFKALAEEAEKLSKVTANTPKELEAVIAEFEKFGGKAKDVAKYVDDLVLTMARLSKEQGLRPDQIKYLE